MLPGVSSCDGAIARLRNGELFGRKDGDEVLRSAGRRARNANRLCALRAELEWRT